MQPRPTSADPPPRLAYASGRTRQSRLVAAALRARAWLRRHQWRLLATITAFVVLGYVSNAVTRRKVEDEVARSMVVDVMRNRPFYVLAKDGNDTRALLDRAGASYTVVPDARAGPAFPWCYVTPARNSLPFIVTVDEGWVLEPLYGSGSRRRFLCLFGYYIELADEGTWAT